MLEFMNLSDEEYVIQNGTLSQDRALELIDIAQSMNRTLSNIEEYIAGLSDDEISDDIEEMIDSARRL